MVDGIGTCEARAVLGAASDHLLLAISQVEIAVLLTDASGHITYINPNFTTSIGYTAAQAIGHNVNILRSNAHDRTFYRQIFDTANSGKSWAGRVVVRTQEGTNYHARALVSCLRHRDGRNLGYSMFLREASVEMKLESQLRQVQKMEAIGELAAGIAHEINTPIQYVGDNIQFFREAMADMTRLITAYQGICVTARNGTVATADLDAVDALRQEIDWDYLCGEVPDAINQAMEGRDRVAEIVRAMKEFAHPGDETLTPVDLNHAIENALSVSRSEWKYVAEVKRELAPDLPAVPCYPGSFNQVLLNLLVNAAHAIGEGRNNGNQEKGLITIGTRVKGSMVEVEIRDTGCGIPEEHLGRIFEPFYTTKDIGKGTGQGLALTHTVIVDRMGGEIDVDSTPGVGTAFLLRLPLKRVQSSGDKKA